MKRSNVTRSKEQSLARKRALIRQLIEQNGLQGDADASLRGTESDETNVEYLRETPDTSRVAAESAPAERCKIIPFPKLRA
jgi:hypothetical protein